MSDADYIPQLLASAGDTHLLQAAQATAAQRLLVYAGETFPQDGCAITLSVLLQRAAIGVDDQFKAIELGRALEARNWTRVPLGAQQKGDVGSTCGPTAHHGYDHIYLVLKTLNTDEMLIADNQAPYAHFRFASGMGRTPTQFFLRAP